MNTLKPEGCGGYIPQVRVVGAVFYAELFNLWSHLSNKFGQFLCSLQSLQVNYKTKQLSCARAATFRVATIGLRRLITKTVPHVPSCIFAFCPVTLQICPAEVDSPIP